MNNVNKKSKVMKGVPVQPPYNTQFNINEMALRDKKKARIHRKEIFYDTVKKNSNPQHKKEVREKRNKIYKDKLGVIRS